MFYRLVLVLAAVLPCAAYPQGQTSCANEGQVCQVVAPERHAVTKIGYWVQELARPVSDRIGPATAEVIDYITKDNVKNSIPNRPRIPTLAPAFLRDLQQAFDELPAAIKQLLSRKLAGIRLAENIGGTGYTEEIVDGDAKPVAGFVVLDSDLLSGYTANAWATWKENTPFKPQAGYELAAEIEVKSEDSRKNAIQYILLHELAHVLSVGEKIHPPWTIEPWQVPSAVDFPYFLLSWRRPDEGSRYATLYDASFPRRADVVYYLGARISAEHMLETYTALEATNFPTLYAATNPFDDWAESFVTYAHTVMMKKPFAIRLYKDGNLIKDYRSCWTEKRCADKRKLLERFLEGR